jgi:uncharacterized protein YlxP (DUF503 family)
MSVGILTLTLHLPECHSLKEKRRILSPILARLHIAFNISVIESGQQDLWQSSELTVVVAACTGPLAEKTLTQVLQFFDAHWPDVPVTGEHIEILI